MLRRAVRLIVLALLLPLAGLPAQEKPADAPPVVEVTARDFEFEMAETIRSGWTTFRLTNRGERAHMLELGRLPGGANFETFRDWQSVIDSLQAQLEAGAIDSAGMEEAVKSHRPPWEDIEWSGGFGLLSPGHSSRLSLSLEPGTYLVLCAVEGPNGEPHIRKGMWRKLTVTRQGSGATPPRADVEMTVADYQITTEGKIRSGKQTVAIHFEGRPESPGNPFQTVDLIPVDNRGDRERVVKWLADGYRTSPPADFLGGSVEVPSPGTAYLTLDLDPGRYAWVSQASQVKGMVQTFTVP